MHCTYKFDIRLVGTTQGPVDAIRACNIGGYRVATAVRHKNTRKLEVIAWDIQAGTTDPDKARLATGTSEYEVGAIAIAPVSGGTAEESHVVTAARHLGGDGLHLTLWKIRPGSVRQVDDVRSDPLVRVEDVAIAALGYGRFVTAAVGTGGKLHLHGWSLAGSFGLESIEQFAHHEGNAATHPALTIVGGRPVVAKRNEAGHCEVVTFDISGAGFRVVDTARTSGTCSEVAITSAQGGVAVAMVDDEGMVQIHAWRVGEDGKLSWIGHRQGSRAKRVTILALGDDSCENEVLHAEHVVAVSVGDGRVRALAVNTDDDPLPLMVDQVFTDGAKGASAAELPGTTRNDLGAVRRVDEILVPCIFAGDDRMRLLYCPASRGN